MQKISKILFNHQYSKFIRFNRLLSTREYNYDLSYASSVSTKPLLPYTIGERLMYAADVYDDREAFVFSATNDRLTFKQLKKKSEDLAAGLVAIGFKKGDRLGIWAPNCIEWILTQYATALIGVIQVNINPAYKSHELEYALNKVKCKGIIMSETYKKQDFIGIISELYPELSSSRKNSLTSSRLPFLENVIMIGNNKQNGCYSFNEILDAGDSSHRKAINNKDIKSSDVINIQYTSGTTGSPKGVMLSHHMILNNSYFATMAQEYNLNKTIICLQVPLYHCFGMVLGSLTSIVHGVTNVLPSQTFDAEESLKAIQKEKCTSIYGTPTMWIDLYNHPKFADYDVSSINAGIMSGSPCPVDVVNNVVTKLNAENIAIVYGLTELSPVITHSIVNDTLENRTQTIGRAMAHSELKVVDENERIVKANQTGELYVRGYGTLVGYWDEKKKTEESYTHDRFFKTGDLVKMNEDGYFNFMGRIKDMVIRGGENIYPTEIENFLHSHPKIEDVHVIGLPDKRMGEELCACIKLSSNETMTAEELKLFCKDKISHFKIPRYVEFMDEYPMTVTGKIQKHILVEKISKKMNL